MQYFKTTGPINDYLDSLRHRGDQIGFVPTMGALHEGHLSLVNKSQSEQSITVVSIFVNPTQFNDPRDLEKYPRTLEEDLDFLYHGNADVVFHPTVADIYPEGEELVKEFDFGTLATIMEGKFRPGHFAGVAQVVSRLLNVVKPNALYMGQKDYQQLAIIRSMLKQSSSKVELVGCPTRRENDGLAMSSRNRRLSPEYRSKAPVLYHALNQLKLQAADDLTLAIGDALKLIVEKGLKPEYLEVVDGYSLERVKNTDNHQSVVACVAAWAGEVRLIDNIMIKS